jgi:SAM-dependent methyltransferase
MSGWFDDDSFWLKLAPFMFGEEVWQRAPGEVNALLELSGAASGSAVLDMGCGPGRHSLELARRGFSVSGVDRTRVYLAQAREQAAEEGLDIEFIEQDMRDYVRPDSFDLALSLFTTFGFFEEAADNQQVLANVYTSLHEGGVLVMEMMGKEVLARIFQQRDWSEKDGVFLLLDRLPARDWSWMDSTWIVIDNGDQTRYKFGHWLYSAVELTAMLKEAGFAAVDIYGNLEGGAYDLNATRLVAVARK